MKKITTFLLMLLLVLPAMAATPTTLYLTPNSNWKVDNARFAAYFFGNGETWVNMTKVDDETDLYQVDVPTSKSYPNVIFCRMNPSTSANNWNNKWNQTGDLTIPTNGNNHYTVKSGTWDKGGGSWSTYTPPVAGEPSITLSYNPETVYVNNKVTFTSEVENVDDGYVVVYSVGGSALTGDTWTPTAKGDYTVTATVKLNGEVVVATSTTITVKVDGLYIQGTMNGWGESDEYFMPKGQDGSYSWTGNFPENAEFKITKDGNWYGKGQLTITPNDLVSGSDNIKWLGGDKNITITIDAAVKNMNIVVNGDPAIAVPEELYIVGSMAGSNWSTFIPMTKNDNRFTWIGDFTNGTEFKFTLTGGWGQELVYDGDVKENTSYKLTAGSNNCKWTGNTSNVIVTVEYNGAYPTMNVIYTPTITLGELPSEIYVNDEVTFTSTITNNHDYTEVYYVNGEAVENPWTPTEDGEYTIQAKLMNGDIVLAESESKPCIVKNRFYVYLLKVGAWNPTYIFYWDAVATTWPGNELTETETIEGMEYYKYTFTDVASINIIFNAGENKPQTPDIKGVTKTTYYRITNQNGGNGSCESSETPFEPYPENIICEQNYFLEPGVWNVDGAWYAAYFFNKNTGAETWVAGEVLSTNYVLFYLSKYNVPANAPARAKVETEPVYTHVIFCRMNPATQVLSFDGKWNQTVDLAYDGGSARTYQITGWGENDGRWIELPSAIEAVETEGGIVYAGNVVRAEGAIYVYNLSGAVVAYGEDNVDLGGLNAGVYVVRNGNNVLKVVR